MTRPKTKEMWLDEHEPQLNMKYQEVAEQSLPFQCKTCTTQYFTETYLKKHYIICDCHEFQTARSPLIEHDKQRECVSDFQCLGNLINSSNDVQRTAQHRNKGEEAFCFSSFC